LTLCHQNCQSCSLSGTDQINYCNKCKQGFYPLQTNLFQCIQKDTLNYLFDSVNFQMLKCNDNFCSKCDSVFNCLECQNNYYKIKDSVTGYFKCATGTQPGYFLDINSKSYVLCNTAFCNDCNQDVKSCEYCINGYYKVIDQNNIVNACAKPDILYTTSYYDVKNKIGYYLDNQTSFRTCNIINCKYCKFFDNNITCILCLDQYFLIKSINKCDLNNNIGKFYDFSSQSFLACSENCNYCSSQDLCSICKNGYFIYNETFDSLGLIPLKNSCKNNSINGYFKNSLLNIYEKCDSSCSQCAEYDGKKCIKCNLNYYKIKDERTEFCYLENYFNQKSQLMTQYYYLDNDLLNPCDKSCLRCTENSNKCIDCSINFYKLEDNKNICI